MADVLFVIKNGRQKEMGTKIPDWKLILEILNDGLWHNAIELFNRCKPGCINWALRARISDLKKKGYNIESKIDDNKQGAYRWIKQIKQQELL